MMFSFNVKFRVINMAVLRLLYLYLAVIVALSEAVVIIHFDRAPPYHSSSDIAIFEYSVTGMNGSNLCTKSKCSILCEVDGQTLPSCPSDVIVLKNLTVNLEHHFRLNVTTKDGKRNSSSYTWFIDTIPPSATIFSSQRYTSAAKIAAYITFSEACTGKGGFKCFNASYCDVIVSGPAHVDAPSVHIINPYINYSINIILSPNSTYGRVVIEMANNFCTDKAGNSFTRTNGSVFTIYLDRRPVQVDLWTTVPSYELLFNGVSRTVTATNKMEELKFFLDFSIPVINSTDEILDALHPNLGFIVPLHSRNQGNRRFAFELKNVSETAIITVELRDVSVIGRTGTPVSPVAPLTFLYDPTEPSAWLSTSSTKVTKEAYVQLIIEFTKPVFGFETSMVEAKGGCITRFEELSKALYSLTVHAESQNVSVIVPAGKVHDISGNLNSASNQLEVKHYSAPSISVALHSFMSVGILATSLAATMLSLSTANLEAVGNLASGRTSTSFYGPPTNLHGMLGHLQVFVLSDWISVTLPIEYSATIQGLAWLIPRQKLPWKRDRTHIWSKYSFPLGERHGTKFGAINIGLHDRKRKYHSLDFSSTNFSTQLHEGLPFPVEYPKNIWPQELQNVTIRSTPYGLPLSSSEYFMYFLRGEPMSAKSVANRMESYTGWQDLEMNLFWLGVGGGGLVIVHILTLIFIRWRTQTKVNGILSVPRFELFLLILMLPCISQSSAFVIRGGTTWGILAGALLLAIPGGLIISVCLFLVIAIFSGSFAQYKEVKCIDTEETWKTRLWQLFTGRPTIGKWFYREGLTSSFLPRCGIVFENHKGPPVYIVVDQNDPNQVSRWTESGQNGIGRMRAISSDDSHEETRAPTCDRLLGCARSSYVILDLMRRAFMGVLSGLHSSSLTIPSLVALIITLVQLLYLFTFKPFIRRGFHMVESLSLLCEAGVFGLAIISTRRTNLMKETTVGYLMLAFLCLTFVSHIISQWYVMIKFLIKFSMPQKNSFKFGLKYASKGILLPLLPRKYWSKILPGSVQPKRVNITETERERRDARPPIVDPLGAMTATVVPVLSPGSPGLSDLPAVGSSTTAEIPLQGKRMNSEKRLKGVQVESKNEMRKLRELARASFSGVSKLEEGSTSYGFRA